MFQFDKNDLDRRRAQVLNLIRGTVIVSVQAPDGHPMRDTHTLTHVARACVAGGSRAIRCGGHGGIQDVESIAQAVDVPVFGLTKEGSEGVYITPTVESVRQLAAAGAAVICADATDRPRPDSSTYVDIVEECHRLNVLAMADCSTPEDMLRAHQCGADIISTTLAGYTESRAKTAGPDVECLADGRARCGQEAFIIGEGRFASREDVQAGRASGADAIIIGTAITDPAWITRQFNS
ncbi:N-acetylmannosamine-6-phosphate 2-epimerase [Corynebacterium macginleyi]|uniref:N-acylglucosamine-6-phosphate 2-epimerase n=1 Tax=Corynebacterium macginleyi TaxID=38290 RepID=A0A3M0H4S7_9CORY|nr:N-acetylmannosamine-6-phosphate 2-epimerase [Corynebacterium macginleyi]MBK4141632.1 putative N-acetylmannosamine-6-phosphate 2-epimerase [Corynebacterium macginleyi]MBK4144346.1 putative N-acetylmannosamine-6-phosphate 2-epimerase [Corynebacterium macginleyi]MBK4145967.1 putative N-acetylmannosamine-6-phosphate 2-epimerase [Corynebacterium macginleyi]MBK4151607.1 putative N-acetylmannosamine-6-phosphate 2-epimerase [Corynebacterium macginleyi]MBK4152286.1 putative N-acetylmannosamine-6-pho